MFSMKFYLISIVSCAIIVNLAQASKDSSCPTLVPPCGAYLCTFEFKPVNATLDNTGLCEEFANDCILGIANCIRKENGQSGCWRQVEECPEKICLPCTRLLAPICGTNGCELKTFKSPCLMDKYNCENQSNFIMFSDGECRNTCPQK